VHGFGHASFDRNGALAGVFRVFKGGHDLLRPGDLGGVGSESGVRRADLGGVDEGLAVKAQRPAGGGFAVKAISVGIGVIDPVQRRHAAGPGGQHDPGEVGLAALAPGVFGQAQLFGEVIGSGHERGQTEGWPVIGEGVEIEDGVGAFDHGPQSRFSAVIRQAAPDRRQLTWMIGLGDQHRVGPRRDGAGEIGVKVRTVRFGDPQHRQRAGSFEGGYGVRRRCARGGLVFRRDGVFKVEHQRIRAEAGGLLNRARLVAGHEQGSTQWSKGRLVSHGKKAYKTAMSEATPLNATRRASAPGPVIAITSQVAANPVGGAVTSAVLFQAGLRAVLVPTVVMGRHPGRGAPGGAVLSGDELRSALAAIAEEGLIEQAAAIFTGYAARPDQVAAISDFIAEAARRRPDLPVWVDPILGDGPGAPDDGRLYVTQDTAAAVRDRLVPAASVITPNLFELAWLSGRTLESEAETIEAARALAPAALVTSAPAPDGRVGVLAVTGQDARALNTPHIGGAPNGAGDLFAALALSEVLEGAGLAGAAANAAARTGAVFQASAEAGSPELALSPETLNVPVARPALRRPGAKRPAWAMGVDGCPKGWVGVYADMNGIEPPGHRLFDDFQAVLDFGAQITAVDMPMGFLDASDPVGMRACEREARALLGPRRSSVFPSPLRPALQAKSYEAANAANRAAGGKGLSKQAFNIMGKMAEIDALMSPDKEGFVFETHPETSFAAITGAPAAYAKKTRQGRAERLDLLTSSGLDESLFHPHPYPRKTAAPDDLTDAGLCLLTALRIAEGTAISLPAEPARDRRGLRMAIFA